MVDSKNEVEYYDEISKTIVKLFESNLKHPENYKVVPMIGEISSSLNTLIVNGYPASESLKKFANNIHRLHLDISILIENKSSKKFELVIFEIKIGKNLGLKELSQLIGYCLVSKNKFGVLVNIDKSISEQFSIILDSDPDLTKITRLLNDIKLTHLFGVVVYNSSTKNFQYTESGAIKTIPELVSLLEKTLE